MIPNKIVPYEFVLDVTVKSQDADIKCDKMALELTFTEDTMGPFLFTVIRSDDDEESYLIEVQESQP